MQLPKFLADLKFEQVMMILLTTIIAFCVVVQTINMREQARILADSEKRNRERDKPTVRITTLSYAIRYYSNPKSFKRYCILFQLGEMEVSVLSNSLDE